MAEALKACLKADPKIQNIVATADLGREVDLERISSIREMGAVYEPEQFPGAIIKIPLRDDRVASILLFASGNLVCLGLKNLEDIKETIEHLLKLIRVHDENYVSQRSSLPYPRCRILHSNNLALLPYHLHLSSYRILGQGPKDIAATHYFI